MIYNSIFYLDNTYVSAKGWDAQKYEKLVVQVYIELAKNIGGAIRVYSNWTAK